MDLQLLLGTAGPAHQFGLIIWIRTRHSTGEVCMPTKTLMARLIFMELGMIWMNLQFSKMARWKKLIKGECLFIISISLKTVLNISICGFTTLTALSNKEQLITDYIKEISVKTDLSCWPDHFSLEAKGLVECGLVTVKLTGTMLRCQLTTCFR